ncbi:MAG: hypothetical protein JRJ59_06205, partial [Deltaproteobacteria bacterium]|nr:hypothetical protein [Deltaproteobacteria bacterium]
MKVLIGDTVFPFLKDILTPLLPEDDIRRCAKENLLSEVPWAEVLIPTMAQVTPDIFEAASGLRFIQQHGVGLEGVDIAAATARGIPVCNIPGHQEPANAKSTAEGAAFLMMACAKRLNLARKSLVQGPWGSPLGRALFDQTALIVGLGQVGQALARILVCLGMTVMATKGRPQPELARQLGLEQLSGPDGLKEMLPKADFLVSTLVVTEKTKGMFNRSLFELMKPSAYFINVSRGGVVNEADLVEALDKGLLAGAGLDVWA